MQMQIIISTASSQRTSSWQKQVAWFFFTSKQSISYHSFNTLKENELDKIQLSKKFWLLPATARNMKWQSMCFLFCLYNIRILIRQQLLHIDISCGLNNPNIHACRINKIRHNSSPKNIPKNGKSLPATRKYQSCCTLQAPTCIPANYLWYRPSRSCENDRQKRKNRQNFLLNHFLFVSLHS